jgi:hypothetical protein
MSPLPMRDYQASSYFLGQPWLRPHGARKAQTERRRQQAAAQVPAAQVPCYKYKPPPPT